MKQPDYLERLAQIVSQSKELEYVWINKCEMYGVMIQPIIAALNTSIHTMKQIWFSDTNWNSNEAIQELVKFIANAPKLNWCSISR